MEIYLQTGQPSKDKQSGKHRRRKEIINDSVNCKTGHFFPIFLFSTKLFSYWKIFLFLCVELSTGITYTKSLILCVQWIHHTKEGCLSPSAQVHFFPVSLLYLNDWQICFIHLLINFRFRSSSIIGRLAQVPQISLTLFRRQFLHTFSNTILPRHNYHPLKLKPNAQEASRTH